MTLDELKGVFGTNQTYCSKISTADLANIMKFVNVSLQMDKDTFDYYYEIDIHELIASSISDGILDRMKKQGWSFNSDGDSLILYLEN